MKILLTLLCQLGGLALLDLMAGSCQGLLLSSGQRQPATPIAHSQLIACSAITERLHHTLLFEQNIILNLISSFFVI